MRWIIPILLGATLPNQLSNPASADDKDVPFVQVTIDANPPHNPWYKMVGDITGDGFKDIVVGGSKGPLIAYVYPTWKKIQIADGGWQGVNGEIADLDGDGDEDIVMGGIVWFENPAPQNRPWRRKHIDSLQAHDIEIADLDGDGRLDVVARDQSAFGMKGNRIYIYHQPKKDQWHRRDIDCPHGEGLRLGDIDMDGDADIVIANRWFQNPHNMTDRWVERRYTSQWTEPDAKVEIADINGDQRPDIVLTPAELREETHAVCWYEAPTDAKSPDWTQHVIVASIECVIHSLGVGDLDDDGDIDVAIAEMHQGEDPDEVIVLLNNNQGNSWSRQVLSEGGSHDIVVSDIGDDNDLDIVGANHGGVHPLELWRNDLSAKPSATGQNR